MCLLFPRRAVSWFPVSARSLPDAVHDRGTIPSLRSSAPLVGAGQNTRGMKRSAVTLAFLGALAASGWCAAGQPSSLRQIVACYEHTANRVIVDYVQLGRVPDATVVRELRALENEIAGLAAVKGELESTPPPVVPPDLLLEDCRCLPGRLVVARLRAAGFDPLADRLRGRTFFLPAPAKR